LFLILSVAASIANRPATVVNEIRFLWIPGYFLRQCGIHAAPTVVRVGVRGCFSQHLPPSGPLLAKSPAGNLDSRR
jgi:hypothetical protein